MSIYEQYVRFAMKRLQGLKNAMMTGCFSHAKLWAISTIKSV